MRKMLTVSLGLIVSCGFAAASQGPTGASAEPDGDKPTATQWTLPDDYEAAIFAYQEATQPYVSELSAALQDTLGWSGLQLDLDAKTIQVYVAGSIPSSLSALGESAPLGLEVSVTKSEYSHDFLAKLVQEVFAADKRVVGVSIPVDGSGLRVGVDIAEDDFREVSSGIQSELSAPVKLALFHDEGGGLYVGRGDDLRRFGVGRK